MGRFNRTCILCGKQYKFCSDCRDYEHIEPWHNIYCSENCRSVFNVSVDWSLKKITKDQAKEILSACDLSNRANFKADILTVVNEIMDFKDEPVEESKAEEPKENKEEVKEETPVEEPKNSNENNSFQRRKAGRRN